MNKRPPFRLDRRRFVVSASALSAAALLPACPDGTDGTDPPTDGGTDPGDAGTDGEDAGQQGPPEGPGPEPDEVWAPPGEVDDALFPLGIQVGDVLPTAALISVHSNEARVDVTLAVYTDDGWTEQILLEDVEVPEGRLLVEVTDLWPDFTYAVSVAPTGNPESRAQVSRFRAALPADKGRVVTFGSTSCLGGNAPWTNLSAAAEQKPDFFLLLGDTVYADQTSDDGFDGLWENAMTTQGMRDLSANSSIVATWDDHEVDNNWDFETAGIDVRFPIALAAFRKYLPQRPGGGGPDSLWRTLSWGSTVELFVLDCRGERRDGNYISPEQMMWLQDALTASTARFKIVVNSVPIIDFSDLNIVGTIGAEDRWQGFPAQRAELLDHIVDNAIDGVLFVTGDFHVGGWAYVDPAGGAAEGIIEVLTGPGGSPINPAAGFLEENDRYLGIVDQHNSVLFTCDPDAGTIQVQFYDDAGNVMRETTLSV